MSEPLSLLEAVRKFLPTDSDSDDSTSPTPPSQASELPTTDPEPSSDLSDSDPPFFMELVTEPEESSQDASTPSMQQENRPDRVELPQLVTTTVPPGRKQKLLDNVKVFLSDPILRTQTRQRFVELTNSTIYLENILFRHNQEFLCPQDTADAQGIVNSMMRYIGWVDDMLTDLLETAGRIDYMMGLLAVEDVPVAVRYRRMACVVKAHLKKPRRLEERLMSVWLEFFDEWVHTKFLHLRNAQILAEEVPNMDRLKLTRYMHAVWDVFTRCINNYALYRAALAKIKEQHFVPLLEQLPSVPDVGQWLGEAL